MSDPQKVPFKNEQYLSSQRASLEEVKRLVERLEGCLRVGVRMTGDFTEAQDVVGYIKDELTNVRIPSRDPFDSTWVLGD